MNRRWARPGLWAVVGSHTLSDFYIGAVGATLPFFVTQADYSYAAIGGLSLAMTVVASISQPGFGLLADRFRLRWAVPACIAINGLCMSLSTLRPGNYLLVWIMIALAGLASAAYHPPATIIVRDIAPGSNGVMSVFAAAGNLGVALGPLAVVAVVGNVGLSATPWLILPGIAGLVIYYMAGLRDDVLRQRVSPRAHTAPVPLDMVPVHSLAGTDLEDSGVVSAGADRGDQWAWFGLLMGSMTVWQLCFIVANTFIGVYLIDEFAASEALASIPLALIPASGAVGTLLGGWMADRVGRLATVRAGYATALIGTIAIAGAPTAWFAIAGTCLLGAGIFLPFAPHITLSHSYLPTRIGAASGISIGVTSAIGGVMSAGLGHLADAHGLRPVFAILSGALVVGVAVGFILWDPDEARPRRSPSLGVPVEVDV